MDDGMMLSPGYEWQTFVGHRKESTVCVAVVAKYHHVK